MNNLSINSRIIPKIYFKYVISNKTDNLYTLLNQSKKRNIILYKIFIKDMLISKLNRDIVKIIKKYYLDNACVFKDSKEIKNKVIICQITTEKQIQNIYKYNFTKYIYTVFNLVNKNEHYLKHIINPNCETYIQKYYKRYHTTEYSILLRCKIQIDRINKYGQFLHQIFRLKKGLFNNISYNIINLIFTNMIKLEPNLGFIYINCIKSNKLYNYIYNIESTIYKDELSYIYRDCENEDNILENDLGF
jgi:hypothetical protein